MLLTRLYDNNHNHNNTINNAHNNDSNTNNHNHNSINNNDRHNDNDSRWPSGSGSPTAASGTSELITLNYV